MNNNQLTNDVYQTPSSQNGESFDVSGHNEMSDAEVNSRFHAIEHEAVLQAFNQITQDLEMSVSGYETRQVPQVEIEPIRPSVVGLLEIGRKLTEYRESFAQRAAEKPRIWKKLGSVIMLLFVNTTSERPPVRTAKTIDQESKQGGALFPRNKEVTDVQFFYLPEIDPETGELVDVWHYDQKSINQSGSFTNSYRIKQHGVEKNSTFYDERLGRRVNASSSPSSAEVENLLVFAKKYYSAVTEEVYVKSAAPRFRFGLKSDHDLAA